MVERARTVKIKACDVKGHAFELDADELLSVCIQHEIDHLNGTVFVDHLSRMKQSRIRKKPQKRISGRRSRGR